MPRSVDFVCDPCGVRIWAIAGVDETRTCDRCGAAMTQDWLPRLRRDAQWDDNRAVLVHVTDDPSVPADRRVRYVGSHDAKLKDGYRKVYLRSLQEVNRFEKEHQVCNHVMHFDRNGRDLQDWNAGSH